MYCNKCGSRLKQDGKFCPSCGTKVVKKELPAADVLNDAVNQITSPIATPAMTPVKKSSGKIVFLLSLLAVVIATIIVVVIVLPKFNVTSVNLSEYCNVAVEGYDGYGIAKIEQHGETNQLVQSLLDESGGKLDGDEVSELVDSIKWELSKVDMLTNGEEITITAKYDEDLAKKINVKFEDESLNQTIKGLEPLESYDVFSLLTTTFSGYDSVGVLKYNKDGEEAQFNVSFSADREKGLKNGDKITITASFDEIKAAQSGYKIESFQKELGVSGLTPITEKDLFKGVNVIFSGESPNIIAKVESTQLLFKGIKYKVTPEKGLNAGDKVNVSASWQGSDKLVDIKNFSREFDVIVRKKYIETYEDLNSDEQVKLKIAAEKLIQDRIDSYSISKENYLADSWQPRAAAGNQFAEIECLEKSKFDLDSVYVITSKIDKTLPNELIFLYVASLHFTDNTRGMSDSTIYFSIVFEDVNTSNLNTDSGTIHRIINPLWYSFADLYEEEIGKKSNDYYIDKVIVSNEHQDRMDREMRGYANAISGVEIIFFSSSRFLIEADLRGMSAENMEKARNEIFARHGLKFNSPDLQEHAEKNVRGYRGTIEPGEFDSSVLNEYEKHNIQFILEHEKNMPASTPPQPEGKDDYGEGQQGLEVLKYSRVRYLTQAEVDGFTLDDCWKARNYIYAMRGRKFENSEVQAYANSLEGYNGTIEPKDFDESVFNEYEVYNLKLIADYEAGLNAAGENSELVNTPTGEEMTMEEALEIAEEHWNFTPGDISFETGYALSIRPNSTIVIDGVMHYSFSLRWFVTENKKASTIDDIYVNSETGECKSKWAE